MNKIPGTVTSIQSEGAISLVEVNAFGVTLSALVLESANTCAYLQIGMPVMAFFKESEASLCLLPVTGLSIRNRIPCEIKSITKGNILCHLALEWDGGILHSLITLRAFQELKLIQGMNVIALIKSTEVSLADRNDFI